MNLITPLALALLGTFAAHAQSLIWSANSWVEHTSVPGRSWEIALDHVSGLPHPTYPRKNLATRVFFMSLATNDTGRTFFTDATNEPGFTGFVAGLTDGANGYIRFEDATVGGWLGASEQQYLGRSSLAPDLAGYHITRLGFRVHSFVDGYDPEYDIHTRLLAYSLDFYGAPILVIQRSGASLIQISWITNAIGFTLQSASTLPPSWSSVTNSPQIVGSRFAVSLDRLLPHRFFRLHRE